VREWWLRTVLVLAAPTAVFAALRDDSSDTASKRAEPVLLIVWLAGMAYVLSTKTAAHLMDDHDYDGLLVAVWTFLAGGLFGGLAYFVLGAALHGSDVALGSQGSYRRARHVLAFAAVPVALSLLLWPFELALWGRAVFHQGGTDAGAGGEVFEAAGVALLAWSGCLLLIGVRAVHGWTWVRATAAAAAPAVLVAALLVF
jgi:hypothetical protein